MLDDAKVSGRRVTLVETIRGRGVVDVHGLLMRLDAPGQRVMVVDLDPAHNVRLGCGQLYGRDRVEARGRGKHALLWTSSCSIPAMVARVGWELCVNQGVEDTY